MRPAIFNAIELGNMEAFQSELHQTANLFATRDGLNRGVILLATHFSRASMLHALLNKNGANVNVSNFFFQTPLHRASSIGKIEILKILLNAGANVQASNFFSCTPLCIAAENGNYSSVNLLISRGADVNCTDRFKETPLHKAAASGSLATVRILVDSGAKLDCQDDNGYSPLFHAVKGGNFQVVLELVKLGANTNLKDNEGSLFTDFTEEQRQRIALKQFFDSLNKIKTYHIERFLYAYEEALIINGDIARRIGVDIVAQIVQKYLPANLDFNLNVAKAYYMQASTFIEKGVNNTMSYQVENSKLAKKLMCSELLSKGHKKSFSM